ncbi:MAG: GNAT family N-acetyltransferase [Hyphomonas sp.]|nr:GNAT family N-acetyltransferase [Hyphomonas sp.]MDP3460246.1 GNAT family N-acetyltransferase [Hyphomonas sp.]
MIVRAATPDDYPALADLWFDSWISIGISNETDLSRDGVRERFHAEAATRWRLFAAEREGMLVGFLALVPEECRVDQIFVTPEGKGSGIGRLLMDHAKSVLPARIVLVTHTDNRRARAFYEHQGFRLDRTEEDPVHRRQKCHYVWSAQF